MIKVFSNKENTTDDQKIFAEDVKLDETKLSGDSDEELNPMESDRREFSEDLDDSSPMEPDEIEKSK